MTKIDIDSENPLEWSNYNRILNRKAHIEVEFRAIFDKFNFGPDLVFAEVDFRKSEPSIKNFKQNRTTLQKN